jgi:hypothetical protein
MKHAKKIVVAPSTCNLFFGLERLLAAEVDVPPMRSVDRKMQEICE